MLAVVNGSAPRPQPSRSAVPDHVAATQASGVEAVAVEPRRHGPGHAWWWLRGAAAVLALLAAAAAAVSWQAQYVMVLNVKHASAVAAVEAGIPDAGALIFAALGVALALHGKRALRLRALNAACIAISLAMNALAAGHGWRDLAIWVMPAVIYAVASDTLIGVVRAQAVARQRADGTGLADDAPDLLAVLGGTALWALRLLLAGPSTLRGFRAWVIEECPAARQRRKTERCRPSRPGRRWPRRHREARNGAGGTGRRPSGTGW